DKSISRLSDKFVSITTFDLNSVDSKSIGHDSGKIRLYLMINAFNIALKHPLIGVGVNNGQLYLPLPDSFSRNMDSINSQNNLTEMLLNGGIPSFALYYFPLLFFLYKSLLRKDKNDIDYFIIASVLLKIFIDSGMKSYNDSNHVMFYSIIVFLFYFNKVKEKYERSN
ncbi:O-antigen ligase family protein, partial [Photobacterium swingsii]|uniref:O-antigen ligase family protein n=1 Tax=Photobacterium swingsii TaxID=680026 RepID=UPI003D0D71A6